MTSTIARDGIADAARAAWHARQAEQAADEAQSERATLERVDTEAGAALERLLGEHDARRLFRYRDAEGRPRAEIAGLAIVYDTSKAAWRPLLPCPACGHSCVAIGVQLRELADIGYVLEYPEGKHKDCPARPPSAPEPAAWIVTGWQLPAELADTLNDTPGYTIDRLTTGTDGTRVLAVLRYDPAAVLELG